MARIPCARLAGSEPMPSSSSLPMSINLNANLSIRRSGRCGFDVLVGAANCYESRFQADLLPSYSCAWTQSVPLSVPRNRNSRSSVGIGIFGQNIHSSIRHPRFAFADILSIRAALKSADILSIFVMISPCDIVVPASCSNHLLFDQRPRM